LIFDPKFEIPGQKFSTVEKPTFLIGFNRFDSTHKVATAQMSSETAPVFEPVYDYSDDKYFLAAACVES